MKHPFFKSVLVLAAAAALINCSEENTTAPENDQVVSGQLVASDYCWVLNTDQTLLILATGVVTDVNGNAVGYTDPTFTNIVTLDGTQFIVTNIDLNNLTMLNPGDPIPSNNSLIPGSSATVAVPSSSATIATPASSATATKPTSSAAKPVSSANNPTAKSSSSAKPASSTGTQNNNNQQTQGGSDGTCFDKPSNKYVKPYDNLNVNGASYAYKEDCTINCYYDPQGKNCASLGSSTNNNNNQQQTQNNNQQQSSSSKPKSSSSTPKSSSSQAQQNNNNNSGTVSSNYTIKYVAGGKSGSGYASRYWDCCEPHCAWPEHGGKASTCDARGNKVQGGSQSMCDGGNAGICRGQFPIVVNDTLAFAFAATPGGESNCGKCFDLVFTGQGKYATDNHTKLKGKHLIVMSNNVGYDVAGGQFDIMIPGGGFGIFDGCSAKMGWGSQGARYGGLLTECEESSGYKASTYKSCLTNKCNTSFANDPEAKQGCLFLANWMNAAGNPLHNYKEVECPQELIARF